MPNCDWYATPTDNKPILDFIFEEKIFDVYENASEYKQPLKRFNSTQEVLAQFNNRYPNGKLWHSVYLQLYVKGSGPPFKATRISLKPQKCDGATYRYAAKGVGLIQFYIEKCEAGKLRNSHTNHNSKKRAEKWAGVAFDFNEVDRWDFDLINKVSSRLNRQIRKQQVAKFGPRVVFQQASELWKNGTELIS